MAQAAPAKPKINTSPTQAPRHKPARNHRTAPRGTKSRQSRLAGTPCERQVRGRLFTFYDWCAQHEDAPELQTLANTIARWENEIVTAVVTGVTNATAESLNPLAKLEARRAYGFRNPANQRRRVRIACTRGTRRQSAGNSTIR
jgi:transposase